MTLGDALKRLMDAGSGEWVIIYREEWTRAKGTIDYLFVDERELVCSNVQGSDDRYPKSTEDFYLEGKDINAKDWVCQYGGFHGKRIR